jgi:FkbM family methyltransferase
MTLLQRGRAKIHALGTLARMVRDFRNWPAIWSAYRGKRPVPPLTFRSGINVEHLPEDDVLSKYMELFVRECYTGNGFYRPRPGDVVMDIGANIGMFTLYLQYLARGVAVHCYEPASSTRARLQNNLDINGLHQWVRVHPVGVSDAHQTLVLHGNQFSGRRSTVAQTACSRDKGNESIECLTLGEAVRLTGADHIALLKIDVEGAEVDILKETDSLTWSRIDRVALEFHGSLRPGARTAVETALRNQGFGCFSVHAPTPDEEEGTLRARR